MRRAPISPIRWWMSALLVATAAIASCGRDTRSAVEPTLMEPSLAKGGGGGGGGGSAGGGGVKVSSASPSRAPAGTRLEVRVLGGGFTAGATASWAIKGVPSSKVTTNSTRFVSSRELVADITIAADADITLYDVIVLLADGKKGIGAEKFAVTIQIAALPVQNGSNAQATAINDAGVIAGSALDGTGASFALRWVPQATGWAAQVLGPGHASLINDRGVIVGTRNGRVIVWPPGQGEVDLGPGMPNGLNSAGTIVGSFPDTSGNSAGVWRAMSATTWAAVERLPKPANSQGSWANGINDLDQIVGGHYRPGDNFDRPILWTSSGGQWGSPVELLNPPGAVSGSMLAISTNGSIVGGGFKCFVAGCGGQGIYWATPTAVAQWLPDLGGAMTLIQGMNDAAQVVGFSAIKLDDPNRIWHGFVWSATSGVMTDLGTLGSDPESEANDINNNRQVVGLSRSGGFRTTRAVVWTLP
jgi:probable HAF family extracellular repeat protein